jgi:hypothetical protein
MDIDYNPALIVAVIIFSIGAIILVSKYFKLCCFDTMIVPPQLTAEERYYSPTIQGISIEDESTIEDEPTIEYPPPPYQE